MERVYDALSFPFEQERDSKIRMALKTIHHLLCIGFIDHIFYNNLLQRVSEIVKECCTFEGTIECETACYILDIFCYMVYNDQQYLSEYFTVLRKGM